MGSHWPTAPAPAMALSLLQIRPFARAPSTLHPARLALADSQHLSATEFTGFWHSFTTILDTLHAPIRKTELRYHPD